MFNRDLLNIKPQKWEHKFQKYRGISCIIYTQKYKTEFLDTILIKLNRRGTGDFI